MICSKGHIICLIICKVGVGVGVRVVFVVGCGVVCVGCGFVVAVGIVDSVNMVVNTKIIVNNISITSIIFILSLILFYPWIDLINPLCNGHVGIKQ